MIAYYRSEDNLQIICYTFHILRKTDAHNTPKIEFCDPSELLINQLSKSGRKIGS